jgi:hypothetical protein
MRSSATARLYQRKRDLLVSVVQEGLQRLDGELEKVIEHAATLTMLRRRATLRADLETCADVEDVEGRLDTTKSPQQDLIEYIHDCADPTLSLDGAATEVERRRQERAMHVSRLGQKMALDDIHCEAALAGMLEGCGDGDDSFEDVCDARIATWYEAELDFIDSERSRQQAFLADLLHVVNTNEPTSPTLHHVERRLLAARDRVEA